MNTTAETSLRGTAGGSVRTGAVETDRSHTENKKRLLDALSWLVETWKTSISVKDAANGRCLCGYVYLPPA